ncbi:MAG: DUF3880 domain-containing protein [Lachnospiraceae bacterium]|nr:DUF3880 domain-containing protein [Lachnospiraceae bacterium]
MNILFYRYGSICEPDLIAAFREYGITVYESDDEITDKNILPAQRAETLSRALFERNYSFVFSINFYPDISEVCNIFHIPYMCLIVDSPILELYSNSLANPCNRVFLFDKELYREFHPVNPDCIFHIPLATNVGTWNKIIDAAHGDEFSSDIAFVGSLYSEKCPFDHIHISSSYNKGFIDGLIEAQLRVYGYFFVEEMLNDTIVKDIMKDYPEFYRFMPNSRENYKAVLAQYYIASKITCEERLRLFTRLSERFNVDIYTASDTSSMPHIHNRGLARTLTEMPLIFNHAAINLNPTAKSIRSGLPLRVFDILGCRGFMLTNYQPELPEYFTIGEHLDIYESLDDLEYKVDYYLRHPAVRKEIAHNGYEYVCRNHTYAIRVGQMIQAAFGGGRI